MILLVHSTLDLAGKNIAKSILGRYRFKSIGQTYHENTVYQAHIGGKRVSFLTLEEETTNSQYLQDDYPDAGLVVFISRHRSESGRPTLSVHTTGNFGEAELGGLPHTLSVAPAHAMQIALKKLSILQQEMGLEYEISFEGTHHGPTLNLPVMFVELGSSEVQWNDMDAAQAVGDAAIAAIAGFSSPGAPVVLGLGGPHYNRKFTHMALSGEAVFGHMIPKYAISKVDSTMISQCIKRTMGNVSSVVLDWKGITSQDKPTLLAAIEANGLPITKV